MALAGVAGRCGCGWWFRPTRCAWRSFLVLLVALAGVAGPLRVGGWSLGPLGTHVRLLAAQRPGEGPVAGRFRPFQAHSVRMVLLPWEPARRGSAPPVWGR